ncbi:hypothetical protein BKA70DRAFT_517259 [Coprinopsis sp. MPI-PUGE-AT-0042]|nr:hypothetical protein BKA70DRAFT_517259 [Coprinopsis sp. MPI-PUGE-AT-0042]
MMSKLLRRFGCHSCTGWTVRAGGIALTSTLSRPCRGDKARTSQVVKAPLGVHRPDVRHGNIIKIFPFEKLFSATMRLCSFLSFFSDGEFLQRTHKMHVQYLLTSVSESTAFKEIQGCSGQTHSCPRMSRATTVKAGDRCRRLRTASPACASTLWCSCSSNARTDVRRPLPPLNRDPPEAITQLIAIDRGCFVECRGRESVCPVSPFAESQFRSSPFTVVGLH